MTGWQLLKPHSEPVPDQRQTILRRFPDGCQFGLGRGSPYLGLQGGGKFIAG